MHELLESQGKRPRTGKVINCPSCGNDFYRSPSAIRIDRVSYCSRDCAHKGLVKAQVEIECKQCGKTYTNYRSQIKHRGSSFCSMTCQRRYQKEQAATPKASSQRRKMRGGRMRSIDNLFSKIIRTRDGSCQRCGTTETLQCSHVIPRTFLSVRWNTENAITLCYRCHIYWWHKYPHEATAWFNQKYPGRYDALREVVNAKVKIKRDEEYERLKQLANL